MLVLCLLFVETNAVYIACCERGTKERMLVSLQSVKTFLFRFFVILFFLFFFVRNAPKYPSQVEANSFAVMSNPEVSYPLNTPSHRWVHRIACPCPASPPIHFPRISTERSVSLLRARTFVLWAKHHMRELL